MRKLTLALALILTLSLIAGVACGNSSSPGPGATPTPSPPIFTPTASPSFAVDYPSGWTWSDELLAETENAVAAFRSPSMEDSFHPCMTVTKTVLPISLGVRTVFQYAQSAVSDNHMATEFPGYVSVSDEDITVEGLPAIRHVFTYDDGGLKLKAKRLWIVKEMEAWVVSCVVTEASFDSWEPVLDDVVLSFNFL